MLFLICFFWLLVPALFILSFSPFGGDRGRQKNAGKEDRQDRSSTTGEVKIFRLAEQHHGKLTVSEVVIATGLSPARAEALLQSITDGIRVRMEVSETGTVVYEFPELSVSSRRAARQD